MFTSLRYRIVQEKRYLVSYFTELNEHHHDTNAGDAGLHSSRLCDRLDAQWPWMAGNINPLRRRVLVFGGIGIVSWIYLCFSVGPATRKLIDYH